MRFPMFNALDRVKEMTTQFNGLNHTIGCPEGSFFDMKNITSDYFPFLSPRNKRVRGEKYNDVLCMYGLKDDLCVVDYKDGKAVITIGDERILEEECDRAGDWQIVKMGAYLVFFPIKMWYNTATKESGHIENEVNVIGTVTFTLADSMGNPITYHDADYYKDHDAIEGDYRLSVKNGVYSLQQYSSASKIWVNVTTTYVQIASDGISEGFKDGDGVFVATDNLEALKGIFVNEEEDGRISTNTVIKKVSDGVITIPGLIRETVTTQEITVKRKCPDIRYVTECNNRLWGCSYDGHEIYCTKLGDVTNWNCFEGISTDSYAANVGSDGLFTGAVTYDGYPIFFKEDTMLKVSVSNTGAHSYREMACRGVQEGSSRSICIINEMLYYKAPDCVCLYTGSVPISISESLGEVRYFNAVGGNMDYRYYISMTDSDGKPSLFVYDTKNQIWVREDDSLVGCFAKLDDFLAFSFVDASNDIKNGQVMYIGSKVDTQKNANSEMAEEDIEWSVESGDIYYSQSQNSENKYVAKIGIRLSLEYGSRVSFAIMYDSDGFWETKFNISGKGTRQVTIPVIPRRCEHFRYKLTGVGESKIYAITKTMERGSDT